MSAEFVSWLANHVWQSTLFAGLAGLLTLALRHNHARVRHGVWLAASCKFLIPLSVLVALGGQVHWRTALGTSATTWTAIVEEVGQPFAAPSGSPSVTASAPPAASPLPEILLGVWACGFLGIGASWWIRWRRLRAVVRTGSPLPIGLAIRAISSRTPLEPGVFGIFRPVLLVPEGILENLAPEQVEAVVAHELCHVRHRDNLAAAVQMFIETAFWFHPLVWWMGKRMVAERERACDEEVLRLGVQPRVYAEGILNVCRCYLPSPLACASGVTGSDLKKRIAAIVTHRAASNLDMWRRILLAAAASAALLGPVAIGVLGALPVRGQNAAETPAPAFEAASVKRHPDSTGKRDRTRTIEPGRITVMDTSLGELIMMAYGVKPYQISGPGWITDRSGIDTYDVVATAGKPEPVEQIRRMLGRLLADRFHLAFHRETRELPVFALLVAKGGPKFKHPGDGGDFTIRPNGEGGLTFKNASMDELAGWFAILPSMGRPVIDRTGLAGSFSFDANLFNLEKGAAPGDVKRSMVGEDAANTLRAMLPDQLGLKMEAVKAPVQMIVIDHAEKVPTEN